MKIHFPWGERSARRSLARFVDRQSGVALVATLIMLSLVTFMVVAFLGVARRERRSVEASLTQGESRMAMDNALARAQADLLARLLTTGDKWSYGAMAPTNFQNPNANLNAFNPLNVNHTAALAAGGTAWLTNLANLQYDPLLPVYSPYFTNRTPFAPLTSETNLGRWYLDLNRNSQFDGPTNGLTARDPHWIGMLEHPGVTHHATNRAVGRYTYYIVPAGKTLDLNLLHNQAKRRAGVTSEGFYKNLGLGAHEMNTAALLAELNPYWGYGYDIALGNASQFVPNTRDAFRDALNLLLFRNNGSYNNFPNFATQFGAVPAQLLTNTQFDVLGNGGLMAVTNLTINVDPTNVPWPGGTNTSATAQRFFDLNELFLTTRGYSGNFTTNLHFLGRTNEVTWTTTGDRNRRTFYNLLNTLGTESWPVDGKLNLNWSNAPFNGTNIIIGSSGGDVSGFTEWHADYFFFNAAELMIRASFTPSVFLNTNWTGFGGAETNVLVTNYYFGTSFLGTNVGINSLSVTNIPLFGAFGNYYTPEVHRLLQFTANLYDATTSNNAAPAYPTLFRPYFAFNTNGWPSNDFVKIVGYTTNGTDTNLLSLPIYDLTDTNSRLALYAGAAAIDAAGNGTNFNAIIAGTPVIIGAKKGFPNFNEFGMQTLVSASRRLEYVKSSPTNLGPLAISGGQPLAQTNQSLILSLFNINAMEGWNSYAGDFPPAGRTFRLAATNISQVIITNESGPLYTNTFINGTNITIGPGGWRGTASATPNASFRSFLFTNVPNLTTGALSGNINLYFPTTNVFIPGQPPGLPGFGYATNYPALPGFTNGGFVSAGSSTFNRSNGFPDMRLGMTVTNTIIYALYEPASNRVVDFVSLGGLAGGMDIATALWSTNGNPAIDNADYRLRRFFIPTRVGASNILNPTIGITNQFAQSTNHNASYISTNLAEWTGWNGSLVPPANQLRREIERFRRFMGLPPDPSFPANQTVPPPSRMQAPYTATRVVAISSSWEVNDPLVHYTARDLEDLYRPSAASRVWKKPLVPLLTSPPPPGSIYSPGYANTAENYPVGRGVNPQLLGLNRAYMPWGRGLTTFGSSITLTPTSPGAYDVRIKDPGAWSSDSWDFPQRKFANLGWMGRVHRGTPWQTFYLKSEMPNPTNWFFWAHSTDTNPTNDWRLVDVFSTAINADATRGLLSVNQTNGVAWAAALGGTLVLSNNPAGPQALVITPQTLQFSSIIGDYTSGLINTKQRIPMWQPVGNYSPGDVVGYFVGPYGFVQNYMALQGTNQNQNPYAQVSVSNNFTYWTNVYFWNQASNYPAGAVVAHGGVSYYSLAGGNVNFGPHTNRTWWEPYVSRSFTRMGGVLATPELSVRSPYLNTGAPYQFGTVYAAGARVYFNGWSYVAPNGAVANAYPAPPYMQYWQPVTDALSDVLIERIPQQTLGLFQLEQSPRVKIYAYGQSLRPADRGLYVLSGPFQGMVTNYQITGESVATAVVRIDGLPEPGFLPRPLPPGAPQQVQPRMVIESFKLNQADP